ncbi:MAG: hypothetical protein KGL53_16165, partial [Elusimicrobia bacterium]|nr:hypothetical protein [Elusimicrobiota bacterium]
MSGADRLLSALLRAPQRVFGVADAAAWTGLAPVALSRALGKAARLGAVLRLKRGVWASLAGGRPHPFEAVPYLSAPWPSCVSLYSALAAHGVVAETPSVTYAVTAGPPFRLRTPLGEYSFHHLPARLLWGWETRRAPGAAYPLADAEKAFLDTLYLAGVPRSPIRLPPRR